MIFKQFRYEPLNQASYLIGCARAKECFVVDPIDDLGVAYIKGPFLLAFEKLAV